jgi:hypothetical protein
MSVGEKVRLIRLIVHRKMTVALEALAWRGRRGQSRVCEEREEAFS